MSEHMGDPRSPRVAPLPFAAMLLIVAGCERDPGRDVRRMTPPLESTPQAVATSDTLPLDEVRKSQAAAVAQRIADTEVTVTYSRPSERLRNRTPASDVGISPARPAGEM